MKQWIPFVVVIAGLLSFGACVAIVIAWTGQS
jgi:hypothetical protein